MIRKLKTCLTDFEVTNEEIAMVILLIMWFIHAGITLTYTATPLEYVPIYGSLILNVVMIVAYYIYTNVKKWYHETKSSETTTPEL